MSPAGSEHSFPHCLSFTGWHILSNKSSSCLGSAALQLHDVVVLTTMWSRYHSRLPQRRDPGRGCLIQAQPVSSDGLQASRELSRTNRLLNATVRPVLVTLG